MYFRPVLNLLSLVSLESVSLLLSLCFYPGLSSRSSVGSLPLNFLPFESFLLDLEQFVLKRLLITSRV
jgi:hypothetical protein